MKKVLSIAAIVFFVLAGVAIAQTWFPANQKTVAWDPVTTLGDGSTVPAGDAVKYQVWTRRGTDPAVKVGGEIAGTQLTITFTAEGRYLVGVQAIRYPQGETVGQSSAINWSDSTDVAMVPSPFGIVFYAPPAGVKNFRPVSP